MSSPVTLPLTTTAASSAAPQRQAEPAAASLFLFSYMVLLKKMHGAPAKVVVLFF